MNYLIHNPRLTKEIRERLMRFVNRRERAFREIRRRQPSANFRHQLEAIEAIRIQLQASAQWSLASHVRMVVALRYKILLLLPSKDHHIKGELTYRKHMIELVNFCEDQLGEPYLFKQLSA